MLPGWRRSCATRNPLGRRPPAPFQEHEGSHEEQGGGTAQEKPAHHVDPGVRRRVHPLQRHRQAQKHGDGHRDEGAASGPRQRGRQQ